MISQKLEDSFLASQILLWLVEEASKPGWHPEITREQSSSPTYTPGPRCEHCQPSLGNACICFSSGKLKD